MEENKKNLKDHAMGNLSEEQLEEIAGGFSIEYGGPDTFLIKPSKEGERIGVNGKLYNSTNGKWFECNPDGGRNRLSFGEKSLKYEEGASYTKTVFGQTVPITPAVWLAVKNFQAGAAAVGFLGDVVDKIGNKFGN